MANHQERENQITFFEQLKHHCEGKVRLAEELSDLLDISIDSVYRRMRGEVDLTFTEFQHICAHYNYVHYNEQQDQLLFINGDNGFGFGSYSVMLNHINELFQQINKQKNMKYTVASEDITFFMLMLSPLLYRFKLHFWVNTFGESKQLHVEPFDANTFAFALQPICRALEQKWLQANSIEIVGKNPIASILQQIEYYQEAGLFAHNNDLISVREALLELINRLEAICNQNLNLQSDTTKQLKLYVSDIPLGNQVIIAEGGEKLTTFISTSDFSFLYTHNEIFGKQRKAWTESVIHRSFAIQESSSKQRRLWFNELRNQINQNENLSSV
jgi:hypothetical protein